MRIVILNADYPGFLEEHYAADPRLAEATFDEQLRARNASLFGVADFYSRGLRSLGHEAWELHVNNGPLQRAWAREHGLRLGRGWRWPFVPRRRWLPWGAPWFGPVLEAQMEHYRPDVILDHVMLYVPSRLLRRWRERHGATVVGQVAAPLDWNADFGAYDLILSSLPNFVERFRRMGLDAELFRLGFDPAVLEAVPETRRDVDVSFVGSLFPAHKERAAWLEEVARRAPLKVWGPDADRLSPGSPIRAAHQGPVWGRAMYAVLRRSRITLNRHIDIAGDYANNMRLYEATGVGALLITDWKENLAEMFEPGREVVAYRSAQECVEQITYYLEHEDERAAIAAAGQARTLREHTYLDRMRRLIEIVERHLQR